MAEVVGVGGDAADERIVEPGAGAAAVGGIRGDGEGGDLEARAEADEAADFLEVVEEGEALGVGEDGGDAEDVEGGDGFGEDVEAAEGEGGISKRT